MILIFLVIFYACFLIDYVFCRRIDSSHYFKCFFNKARRGYKSYWSAVSVSNFNIEFTSNRIIYKTMVY